MRKWIHRFLGDFKSRKDWEEALIHYNEAIKLDPDYVEAYNHRGRAKDELGDSKGATEDYNKAIELEP